ncbi:MAG: SDR family oxidoreductase [Candidatus Heimdallarchaeaceae archaeon]
MNIAVIIGANRGLGLEFTTQLLKKEYNVIATCREPDKAKNLQKLKAENKNLLSIVKLDVRYATSRDLVAEKISKIVNRIDLLINNAGIIAGTRRNIPFGELYKEDFTKVFQTNSIGPLLLAERLIDLIKRSPQARIINVSSQMGSITRKSYGGEYSYSASKAALNMFTKLMANDLRKDRVIVLSMHPGWVQTDMGGTAAPIKPKESVQGMIAVIEKTTMKDTGKFLDYQGNELPW